MARSAASPSARSRRTFSESSAVSAAPRTPPAPGESHRRSRPRSSRYSTCARSRARGSHSSRTRYGSRGDTSAVLRRSSDAARPAVKRDSPSTSTSWPRTGGRRRYGRRVGRTVTRPGPAPLRSRRGGAGRSGPNRRRARPPGCRGADGPWRSTRDANRASHGPTGSARTAGGGPGASRPQTRRPRLRVEGRDVRARRPHGEPVPNPWESSPRAPGRGESRSRRRPRAGRARSSRAPGRRGRSRVRRRSPGASREAGGYRTWTYRGRTRPPRVARAPSR